MRKLILALSTFKRKRGTCEPVDSISYTSPCGGQGACIQGAQTNDAPVKYLLKYMGADTIVALLTREAKEDGWQQFQDMVRDYCREEGLRCPDFKAVEYSRERDGKALHELLEEVKPEDEICLDTTGGFRDLSNLLLLVARLAEFRGNKLRKAVYSDFQQFEIRDVTASQYGMLDVISGMGECVSYGQTGQLMGQWGGIGEAKELLDAMQNITDAVTLCKTHDLGSLYAVLNDKLKPTELPENPDINLVLLEQMKNVFRREFGDGRIDDVAVIRWCLENRMLQQAITLYVERMPGWIMGEKKLLTVEADFEEYAQKKKKKEYQDICEFIFTEYFLRLFGGWYKKYAREQKLEDWQGGAYRNGMTRENLNRWRFEGDAILDMKQWIDLPGSPFRHQRVRVAQLQRITKDYWYIKEQRNRYNHALREPNKKNKEAVKQFFAGYQWGESVTVEGLTKTITAALNYLEDCVKGIQT